MKTAIFLLATISLFSMAACTKTHVSRDSSTNLITLGDCLNRTYGDDDLSLCFVEVISDSRCPAGMVCIWAGTGIVKFSFTRNGQTQPLVLATGAFDGYGSKQVIDGYLIELIDLNPYPGAQDPPVPGNAINVEVRLSKL